MEKLLGAWKDWTDSAATASPDQTLPEDRQRLNTLDGRRRVVRWASWRNCRDHFDPWDENTPLHTGLVPLPYVGDVRRAKVYFLLLNPGLSATDYYAEYKADGFRVRLLANLRQDFAETDYPFFPLDPECAWHSGNAFWEKKLKHILLELSKRSTCSHAEVRKFLAQNICAVEMLPYHSISLDLPSGALEEFSSVALARGCVQSLVPQAQAGNCMLVAMRQAKAWKVPLDSEHVLQFSGGQARGAHLSTKTNKSHGTRIVKFLLPHLMQQVPPDYAANVNAHVVV